VLISSSSAAAAAAEEEEENNTEYRIFGEQSMHMYPVESNPA
jgi:hypothetical protein